MKPFSSFIQFTIFLSFLIATQGSLNQNLIDSTCRALSTNNPNIDYNFCTTSLQAFPSAKQNATLQNLGLITIQLIEKNVTDTKCYIQYIISNKKWDPYAKQCLSDCLELFSDSDASVKQAVTDYKNSRFDDANVQISSVMDAATTCEDGFDEERGVDSGLKKRNDYVFQLSAMALSVMNMIQNMNKLV
ncbi:putative invertase inhibitor [Primulina huaijiensis]|uniref:putative invertase inhibitor n=1 Tax=Primulina huaijiensis TaxID=1492673 RepID=UPI003CC7863D